MEQRKLVIVINGKGGVGKDAVCSAAAAHYRVRNVSAITPIKKIARQCGWNGEKDNKSRKFLADLKQLLVDYNGLPNTYLEGQYRQFRAGEDELLFVHIREAAQIEDFLRRIDGKKVTLLVRSNRAAQHYGNAADDDVESFRYDYCFQNDGTLEELPERVHAFLQEILREQGMA